MKRYTAFTEVTRERAKYVKINFLNDEAIPSKYNLAYVWANLIVDNTVILIFDMQTTVCYAYTKKYFESHPKLKRRFNNNDNITRD